ncbi:putative AraC family transcriptional regulator [Phycisphaera mikurensis NBRC 102666]|uniref:Putative AraC family transcriptional regulator n=1 Tax=Phycisphaera mikurensis (strain NBRC 102666 / KCTC 22515 / FYK2301M01) TaxID=1142394 RepID=I0ICQ0_PHYMF|nr:putative AraC family transcriptional regulator [Phycisphaera mikurensis NBRC 102666]
MTLGVCGRVRCEPGWRLDACWWRDLRDFDLWLVWAGRGRMTLTDGVIDLRPGVCVWMRPGRRYEAEQDPDDRLGVTYLHFEATRRGRRVPDAALPPEVLDWDDLAFADAVARRVVERAKREPPAADTTDLLLAGLLADYAAAAAAQNAEAGDAGVSPAHRRMVDALRSRIREEPGAAWSVAAMAAEAGHGGDRFRAIFRAATGVTPRRFVTVERVRRARHLLRETGMNVGEVAEALGYTDAFHFSRQFKAETGGSPSAFRRGEPSAPPRTAGPGAAEG